MTERISECQTQSKKPDSLTNEPENLHFHWPNGWQVILKRISQAQQGHLTFQQPLLRAANGTRTVIATRDFDSSDEMDESPNATPVAEPGPDEAYEVRRSTPRHGDSYVGGLDILTVHRMIEEQNKLKDTEESSASN